MSFHKLPNVNKLKNKEISQANPQVAEFKKRRKLSKIKNKEINR